MFDLSAYSWDRIKQKQAQRDNLGKKPTRYKLMTPEQKAKRNQRVKAWRERNPGRVKEYWQRQNEVLKQARAEAKAAAPKVCPKQRKRELDREWREKNPERYAEQRRRYIEKRREKNRKAKGINETGAKQ